MRLILGSAQWGLNYGISNTYGKPKKREVQEIIDIADNKNIHYVDTAYLYGDSEKRVGSLCSNKFKIITKINPSRNELSIKKLVDRSLKRLNRKKVYGCLFHNVNFLIDNPQLWSELLIEKEKGKIQKIGCSFYEPNELDEILSLKILPDIVQIPFSILDRKFEKQLSKLKKKKIEIHARSIFLQGLYFLDASSLSKKFIPIKEPLNKIEQLCKENSISKLNLCLAYVSSNPFVDFIVVGVQNKDQLNQIVSSKFKLSETLKRKISSIQVNDSKMLNPAKW